MLAEGGAGGAVTGMARRSTPRPPVGGSTSLVLSRWEPAMPKQLNVDAVTSYAHRDGESLRLVIRLTRMQDATPGDLVLRRRKRSLRYHAETRAVGDDLEVSARVPVADLPDGVWQLALRRQGAARGQLLKARLVKNRKQPVALVTGRRPATTMPPPRPRRPSRAAHATHRARAAVLSAGRAVRQRRSAT